MKFRNFQLKGLSYLTYFMSILKIWAVNLFSISKFWRSSAKLGHVTIIFEYFIQNTRMSTSEFCWILSFNWIFIYKKHIYIYLSLSEYAHTYCYRITITFLSLPRDICSQTALTIRWSIKLYALHLYKLFFATAFHWYSRR